MTLEGRGAGASDQGKGEGIERRWGSSRRRRPEGEIEMRGSGLGLDRQGPAGPWAMEELGCGWA